MKIIDYRLQITEEDRGFVSIFSVLIIMSVLTLILVGFSQVVRRAAQSNLNDQLSTQAFYAAESGVNAAINYIKTSPLPQSKKECKGTIGDTYFKYGTDLDPGLLVGYNCVLINLSVTDNIKFSGVPIQGTAAPKIARLVSSVATNEPNSFDITLDAAGSASSIATGAQDELLPEAARASTLGMLRVDMVPISGQLDRATLVNGGYTFFVDFGTNGNGPPFTVNSGAGSGELVHARCNANAASCTTTINLGNNPKALGYMLRLQSIYNPVNVTISNVKGPNGPITLANGQAVVDVTGQANSVYRRIQVRLPTDSSLSSSFSLLTADSICKRLNVTPTDTTDTTCDIN